MIPYNPSSFNSNKTILEQILELKRWLQAHPSYEVFYSSENGQSTAYTGYLLSSISDPTNLAVGDVVVFNNSTFGVVTSVDTDNGEFGCDPCISLAGPQGPTGPTGVSITNVSVDASNHLICTLSNGTTIDAGVIQYDTYISISGSSGTLTDDEYAKALLNDTKIIETIGTSTLIHTKYGEDSSNIVYRILVPIDVYPSPTTTTQNITINKSTHAWTKTAYKLPIGIDNIKSGAYSSGRTIISDGNGGAGWYFMEGSGIKSTGATSGQVLQADGSGGASWQTPSGGTNPAVSIANYTTTLSDAEFNLLDSYDNSVIIYTGGTNPLYYYKGLTTSTSIVFYCIKQDTDNIWKRFSISVNRTTKITSYGSSQLAVGSEYGIECGSATIGQVLGVVASGRTGWINAGGSIDVVTLGGPSGTLTSDEIDKIKSDNCIIKYSNKYFIKNYASDPYYTYECIGYNNTTSIIEMFVSINSSTGNFSVSNGLVINNGRQLYLHNIHIEKSTSSSAYFSIINDSSTAFTYSTLCSKLVSDYTTNQWRAKSATGVVIVNSIGYNIIGVYAANNTQVTWVYMLSDGTTNTESQGTISNSQFNDNVITL